jgi:dCTP deaminase
MQLPDWEIMAEVKHNDPSLIVPEPDREAYQPGSVDLRLGRDFYDPEKNLQMNKLDGILLEPGAFLLAHTEEVIALPDRLAAQVKGKSTWARLGLMVECAGFVDPGFEGQITLELKNLGHRPIKLQSGAYVCQVVFNRMSSLPARSYEEMGHYMHQRGATPARKG